MNSHPILIIGQGLAGTALAWRLWERGEPFMIVDRDEALTSSKAAAGLLTPITGMRLTLTDNYGPWLTEALRFYRHKEQLLSSRFVRARRHVRWFKNDKEPERWAQRVTDPRVRAFVRSCDPVVDSEVFAVERGGFEMKHAGYLDTVAYLAASRRFFDHHGRVVTADFDHRELEVKASEVVWRGTTYRVAIFATGWEAARHPWFDWVPFLPVRGTILTARADLHQEHRIISKGCWVMPREDGTLRIGSTYEVAFDRPNEVDPAKLAELHETLRRFVKVPVEILDQRAAVRPSIERQRVLIGRHPGKPAVAFLNGLGSKGTLQSPAVSRLLLAHLLDGEPVPPSMDLAGNL